MSTPEPQELLEQEERQQERVVPLEDPFERRLKLALGQGDVVKSRHLGWWECAKITLKGNLVWMGLYILLVLLILLIAN